MTGGLIPGVPPWLLATLVAAAVAAAYFFRARSRTIEVPAVTVWLRVGRPVHTRSLGTILAALASYAAQMLIVGLLFWTLRDPFPRPPAAGRVAIVIDRSATMQTRENGTTRFDAAIGKARQLLAGLPADADVTLLTVSATPTVSGPMPPQAALDVLGKLKPTDTDGDLPATVRAASRLASDPAARAIVLSDFAGVDVTAVRSAWGGPAALELIQTGTDQPNAAVADAWQVPRAGGQTIGVNIASRGMDGRTAAVVLRAGGNEIDRRSITLTNAQTVACEFAVGLPAGTACETRVDAGDALACDDAAYGVAAAPARSIVLVTTGNAPLLDGLWAGGTATVRAVAPDAFDGPRPGETVVVDDTARGRLRPTLRGRLAGDGGLLLVGMADPFAPGGPALIEKPTPTHWAGTHPVLAGVTADLVRFDRAVAVPTNVVLRPVLSAGDVPLIGETVGDPAGASPRTIVWLFRLADTDLPGRVAFPVLLWNTLDYVHGQDPQTAPATTGRGVAVPAVARQATRATGPDGPIPLRRTGDGRVTFDADRAGVYGLDDAAGTKVGVSYVSRRGLTPLPTVDASAGAATTPPAASAWRRPTWQALAGLLLALMLLEMGLYRRGVLRVGT